MSASEQLKNRLAAFRDLGVEIWPETEWIGEVGTDERREVDLPNTVRGLELPFSPQDWCNLAMNEGPYYMGGCCGNMSALQDLVNTAFRFGGSVQAYELSDIASYARGHDGMEFFDPIDDAAFAKAIESWRDDELSPWEKMGLLFSSLEPALRLSKAEQPSVRPLEAVADLVYAVHSTLMSMSMRDLFSSNDDDQVQHAANRLVLQAKVLPLLRDLLAKLEADDVDFEGFAIVSVEDKQVAQTMHGLCLYSTKTDAQTVLDQTARVNSEAAAVLEIRPASVNLEQGLQVH